MELFTSALVFLLLTTASAKPVWHRHQDADIADKDTIQGWLHANNWWSWRSPDSSSYEMSSESSESKSSESKSSESSESDSSEESREVVVTDPPTPALTTLIETTDTTEDGSTPTPEPRSASTDQPPVMEMSTSPPLEPATGGASTAGPDVTLCVTHLIPTGGPITESRGDN